ncbi:tetratricopeptide repeat-containing sensor histidine kinase [Spirosoma flavum]|uniref:histidine kinase n=1 Tax=Spirosoma flavum TaxID=2048557 RepID=A0ABW6ART9_9BACT
METSLRKQISRLPPVQRFPWIGQYFRLLNQQSRFSEARNLIQAALKTAQKNHLTTWEAYFMLRLGHLAETEGNHPVAIQTYLQTLNHYRALHLYDQQQIVFERICEVYHFQKNEPSYQHYVRQFAQLNQRYNQLPTRLPGFFIEQNKWERQGQLDSLLSSEQKVLTIMQISRDWDNYYSALDWYGKHLSQAGRYRKAEQTFRRCLAFGHQQDDQRRILYAYLHLPVVLLHLKQIKEAERYAKLALSRLAHDPERKEEHLTEVYQVLAQIAESKGDYPQALTYERLRNESRNNLLSTEKSRQIAEIDTRYQTAQKQARINELDRDNRRQLTQISWQAVGLLALLALLGLSLWQYRIIQRVNGQLMNTNQTVSQNNTLISEQSDRLAMLMRELNHRVKNNLAIISSLLKMQSKRLTDPLAVQAVQDGQRRVEAISLIHQQIYQTENLMDVPIKSYITDLTKGLLIGYGFNPETFDCHIEVADIKINVELAVPLGLILNEVLTNAFKYAYTNEARPYLKVLLQPDPNQPADRLLIEVQDNGPGLDGPGLTWPVLPRPGPTDKPRGGRAGIDNRSTSKVNPPTFGQRLIRELTGQLGGEMSFHNQAGTCFRLLIPRSAQPVRSLS